VITRITIEDVAKEISKEQLEKEVRPLAEQQTIIFMQEGRLK
jgi:hypothetical protein